MSIAGLAIDNDQKKPGFSLLISNTSKTGWTRIDAMTDDDIDTSGIPPLDKIFFAQAKLRIPKPMVSKVNVPVDVETLD
ncbi:hypothetical protein [Nodosilinea sp. LEGE 07298]|uniref:hypothetical protein n=1 Tax=Nodosilinea sp. LEGE 07298 TaxID=2777970 RepID=UPI001D13F9DD|nr:hypothetical protein [Nodosilinea sp. LEGE 07298]